MTGAAMVRPGDTLVLKLGWVPLAEHQEEILDAVRDNLPLGSGALLITGAVEVMVVPAGWGPAA